MRPYLHWINEEYTRGGYFPRWWIGAMAFICIGIPLLAVGCGPSVQHAGVKTVTQKVYRNPDGKMSRDEFNHLSYGTKKVTVTNHFGARDNSGDDLYNIDEDLDNNLSSPNMLVYPERDGDHHFILIFSVAKHSEIPTLVLKGMR